MLRDAAQASCCLEIRARKDDKSFRKPRSHELVQRRCAEGSRGCVECLRQERGVFCAVGSEVTSQDSCFCNIVGIAWHLIAGGLGVFGSGTALAFSTPTARTSSIPPVPERPNR